MTKPLEKLSQTQQAVVREKVRDLLLRSDAFNHLSPGQRQGIARGLVDVVAFLADPSTGVTAEALAKPAQDDFGKAARTATQAYRDLTAAVDFPEFVAGLIDGVFNSIVDASIRQMEAYGKLLESVVKSVDEFAKDNFTLNQGRDYLVNRFPQQLEVRVGETGPRLAPTSSGDDEDLAEVRNALGLTQGVDLTDETSEAELARRGQLEMARLRQKQLATMVLLGINRIVVTDGLINAKVVVDVSAKDTSSMKRSASSYDDAEVVSQRKEGGGWFSSGSTQTNRTHQTIVKSASDETNDARAEAKAKLTGEVRVNFKSETFPLDRVASQTQIDSLGERARPG